MSNILCFDSLGNPLKRLYQWDINQTIRITGLPDLPTVFHFCNACNDIAYVVSPELAEDGYIVTVPNVLLENAEPLILYSYQTTGEDAYRTTFLIHIPVVPRSKPEDYVPGDNVEHYTVAGVNARVSSLIRALTDGSDSDAATEVADIRDLDGDGTPDFTVAGEAVRSLVLRIVKLETDIITDKTLRVENKPADAKATGDAIDNLQDQIDDLNYKPVSITTFTVSPNQAESGDTVTSVEFSYTLNKVPVTLTLDGTTITAVKTGTTQLTGQSITANKTFELVATDNGSPNISGATATKTATLSFYNRVFWGAASIPGTVNSTFIRSLSSKITNTRKTGESGVTVNAGNGQYIWYAVPTTYGQCSFSIGGFTGGFEPATTVSVKDAGNNDVNYYVYRSTNSGLGSTTVVVS